jgi:hypothetical protein
MSTQPSQLVLVVVMLKESELCRIVESELLLLLLT